MAKSLENATGPESSIPSPKLTTCPKKDAGTSTESSRAAHPSGKRGHGRGVQILRGLAFTTYFTLCCTIIFITQLVGSPLYLVHREWYYAYMSMTKRSFGLTITVMTHVFGPATMRISGDESVAGQIQPTRGGAVEFKFPERLVMIANHQIYTDWIYLWWVGYANRPGMHGHIYIILKESLKYIPIIGTGMMFYGFIFMSRKMATDQPRLSYRLTKLKKKRVDPRGNAYLDPMWLLLFPEGTNLSNNGRQKSSQWAAKNNLKDPDHVMLPRSTGTYFCLRELKDTVEYVYDCTVAYEGVPRGKYGEEIFGLTSTYFQGRPPKSVNLYWRRFKITDIPLDDPREFDLWLRDQWYKKDALMEEYLDKGRFPAMHGAEVEYVETEVRTRYPWEILQIFTVVGLCGLTWHNVRRLLHMAGAKMGFLV
ncbi:uncharacterized protein UV8b_00864 [Ustilaginoidea virens]|uniref:Phospholipid/glycerol acyltransferase domain-containing protein n=1 Tax=Ustilaginoidea virens TaxID=1159556 RepID=A0A1B5L4G3_USTVR|nr:uncharacterized protein UV8b_00864 [Ustilaginoidea virens]QUC16623.1 hypothetical protein UV8b_00864 [Ustilaginoidea virens]GAO18023.1 hypothetical protein UVI_02042700 [Ustilaginoidea virens]